MKNIALATLIDNLSGMCPVRTPEELPTADSSPKCNNASSTPAMRYLIESHGKDGKQRTFPTFPRHGYGDLDESIHEICCTWNLNVPTPPPRVPFSTCSPYFQSKQFIIKEIRRTSREKNMSKNAINCAFSYVFSPNPS
jgi:hypothetical protein